LGQVRPVLWESPARADTSNIRLWSGLADNYLRVHTLAPVRTDLHNRIIPARLARLDGDMLWGEITSMEESQRL
jgi:hypothetical protein